MGYYLCWDADSTPTLGKLSTNPLFTDRRMFEVASGCGTILFAEFEFCKEIKILSIEGETITDIEFYAKFNR